MRSHSARHHRGFTRLLLVLGVGLLLSTGMSCSRSKPASESPEETERTAEREIAPSGQPYSEDRAPCAHRDPQRQALWGELHVHSSLSMDAYLWDVRNGPDETYLFAKGEQTFLPPLDDAGMPTRPARLERPIDFAALTDHASFQGEVALCTRPGSSVYATQGCQIFRSEIDVSNSPYGDIGARMAALSTALDPAATDVARSSEICGANGVDCREAMKIVWREQQAAAERHYDRSAACRFTTLHGYEYTATPGLAKVHHNVIFRNANVPDAPIPWIDEPDVYGLWQKLEDQCLDAEYGCDVITIPHNSNLSNGRMFEITGRDLPLETQRDRARMRAKIETLAEITQIKGDSECRNGMFQVIGKPDEFCNYEEWRKSDVEDCKEGAGWGALLDQGCVSRTDYLRYTLIEGFREEARIGVNPYKLGFIGATDAHNANPGDVEEYSYQGWSGSEDASVESRLDPGQSPINAANSLAANPGGLAGVWAEENSRDAIFDALVRKETFATSGPRITTRFFGGWGYSEDLCNASDLVEQGYAGGVPMGGDLPPRPEGAMAPRFVVSAMRDIGTPEHPGGLLQRAQIVKVWLDDEGLFHQAVFNVAGGTNRASVDVNTCQPQGIGHHGLCRVWTDPGFDANTRAAYYVRVLENPSCRWNQIQCLSLEEADRPPSCQDPDVPKTIQERLWTSPIWYDGELSDSALETLNADPRPPTRNDLASLLEQ